MSKQAKRLKKEQKKAALAVEKLKPSQKVSRIKAKKKVWFKIISPKVFGQAEIGESYLTSAQVALGRKLEVNLKELTGNVRDQNVHINLQINKLDANLLKTSVIGYELSTAFVKRLVRKNSDPISGYFLLKTKGGKQVILKSLMVTLSKAQRSVKAQLNKELGNILKEEVSNSSFDNFVSSLVQYKVQSMLKKRLRKIFPLKEVAVRVLKLQEDGLADEEVVVEDQAQAENGVVAENTAEPENKDGEEESSEQEDQAAEESNETEENNEER
ncbi:MAG TPA: hypothetical protein VJG49_04800 [Candidatus Nanoarchaeia archaeon]|nr:hypothetical protein [Candidatus Nanoarchaeia archaeon]